MKQQTFSGTGVALVTPFKADKAIDFEALERIIEHVITGGVDFIVSLGTTGEAITLTAQECRQVLDFTIEKVDGRKPIVAGLFGGNFTQKIVDGIRNYDFDGIDAIMSSSPAYSKPSQEGIFQHYMKIADVAPRPIIIYNVPGRTCSNVLPETILRLAEASEQFIAVKEASGDVVQAMQIAKNKPENFLLLSGDDPLTLPIIASGGRGVISVIANAFPREFSTMVRAAIDGDYDLARNQNANLLDVHPWLYTDGNPPGVKAAMEILGLCQRDVRIPQTSVSDATFQALKAEIEKVV
jgi:4-hydroxy-tetrahydrodipicolinate synthase